MDTMAIHQWPIHNGVSVIIIEMFAKVKGFEYFLKPLCVFWVFLIWFNLKKYFRKYNMNYENSVWKISF